MLAGLVSAGSGIRAEKAPVSVEITSPLGRSGLPGKVRIVARLTAGSGVSTLPVRFYVDDALLATDTDGPPYAAEWEDENPFEPRRIGVEVDHPTAGILRDEVALEPFEFVEASQVMSVGVDASVQDAEGRFVGSLSASDFQLLEDGVRQELDSVSIDSAPTTYAVLVDASQSMSRSVEVVRQAAGRLSRHIRADDAVVVAPFRNGILNVTGPTRDAATISDAVAAIRTEGGTAILDALSEVAGRFGAGTGRRVVVLVTDGYDERSQGSPDEVLEQLKSSRVTVYVISVGGVAGVSLKGEKLLRRIAEETGGRAFFPWTPAQIAAAHTAIADRVQHQYLITYTPANQELDGAWRTITVATADPGHAVQARAGYRAPRPPPVRASVEFTVTDARQEYVDLTRDELEVLEDGVRQRVEVFNEAIAPVSIMLALDGSGSMTRSAPAVREAAHAFIDALRPEDPLGMILFADSAEMAHDLNTRREISHDAIGGYGTKGGTALHDALVNAMARLRSVEGRRVVVVVTDGRDENAASNGPGSTHTWTDVVTLAREVDATVFAIGLGSNIDRERLVTLSTMTGGEAFFTSDVAELQHHYRRIVEDLRRRYLLAYTSTNDRRDGSWRTVDIRTATAGLRIRSRGGYFAPQQ